MDDLKRECSNCDTVKARSEFLGIPLKIGNGKRTDGSATLDRVLPDLGYVPGNVIVISFRANRIKNDATLDELRLLVEFYSRWTI